MGTFDKLKLPGSKNNWFHVSNYINGEFKKDCHDRKRLRIAFFVNSFPLISETFVLNQITGLIDRGHSVDIYATKYASGMKYHEDIHKYGLLYRTHFLCDMPKGYFKRCIKLMGIVLFTGVWKKPQLLGRAFNYKKYGRTALSLYLAYAALPFLREKPYDILHCQFGFSGPLALSLKQIIAPNSKLVISFRGVDITKNLLDNPGIYDNVFRGADCFLPVCENFKQKLIKEGCDKNLVQVHYSGIDTAKFTFTERIRNVDDITHVYSIGRLVEKKGIAYGIKAVALAIASGRKLTYTIIGDGPLRDNLDKLIKLLRVEKYIKLKGWMTSDEIIKNLENAHILLAPSITSKSGDSEGVPNASKEAMALGIPVISTYHSGNPELIEDGVSGFLVPERDVDALARKLNYLIDNPEIWPEMGRQGRKVIEERFEINPLNEELLQIYHGLLNGNRIQPPRYEISDPDPGTHKEISKRNAI